MTGRATAIGAIAVPLWALLALLTVATTPTPPLLLNAICFGIGGALGVVWTVATGRTGAWKQIPWPMLFIGTAGLFGYHYLYFSALRTAPPEQAGLIAYLWPLLIVMFSSLLPGEELRRGHVAGALIAFGGVALLMTNGFSGIQPAYFAGYALALACALTWAAYSVLSRYFRAVPTESVAIFSLIACVLSLFAHMAGEETVWPETGIGVLAIAALGIGPLGIAFYAWDHGVKSGDIRLLGTLAYSTPVLSTIVLVLAEVAPLDWTLAAAAVLVSAGAFVATRASQIRNAEVA